MNENKKDEVLEREIHTGMLLRFALPTILSTVFMSIYTSVDGMFVARLVNTDALSAVNIVMPLVFISSGIYRSGWRLGFNTGRRIYGTCDGNLLF